MEETAAGLRGAFEYATDLFDRQTIERLVGSFETLLRGIVERGEERVSSLPLLSEAERDSVAGAVEPHAEGSIRRTAAFMSYLSRAGGTHAAGDSAAV